MMKMTRRKVSKGLAAAASSALLGPSLAASMKSSSTDKKAGERKNVLIIVTDQERARLTLPENLNLPARRKFDDSAVAFEQYHIASLSCAPSRSVIYTGQHVQKTRLFNNPGYGDGAVDLNPLKTPTLGQRFKALGYKTAYKGKWHLSSVNSSDLSDNRQALKPFGFDEWQNGNDTGGLVYQGANDDRDILADAQDFMDRQRQDDVAEPWFLAINFHNPHDVMWLDANGRQAATRLRPGLVSDMAPAMDQYPYNHDFGFELPASFGDDLSSKPEAQQLFLDQAQYFYGQLDPKDAAAHQTVLNYYAACLLDSDKVIGSLMQYLDSTGLLDDTIIVMTSDHGEMAGAHGIRHKGPFMYRENINVPMSIRHPQGSAGISSQRLFSALDLTPTLLGLVGANPPNHNPDLKGYDHSDFILGRSNNSPRQELLVNFSNTTQGNPRLDKIRMSAKRAEDLGAPARQFHFPEDFIQFDSRTLGRGIFDGRYKFSRWFTPGDHHHADTWEVLVGRNDLELYDVINDPNEVENLAHYPEQHRALVMQMNTKLNELVAREVGTDLGSHLPGDPATWTAT
jgi:arylsulfatase A-like enzyme